MIALIIICILELLGFTIFIVAICKAQDDPEDYLLKNNPNYLGQGRWKK